MAVILTVMAVLPVLAGAYPTPDKNIADEAGIISEATTRTVINSNEELENSVGAVIAVCTVSTTGTTPIGEYTRAVFRDWRLGESILLLVAVDDMNYYFLQSTAIDSVLTNEELQTIARDYLEEDFKSGSIDTGIMKVTSKLASILSSRMPKLDEKQTDTEKKGTTLGSVIVTVFKVILYIVIFAVVAFIVLFVVAMFNDNVAAFMRKYIFRKNNRSNVPNISYDERLYGSPERRRQNNPNNSSLRSYSENRSYGDRGQANRGGQQYRGYSDEYSAYYPNSQDDQPYYNSDGTRRRCHCEGHVLQSGGGEFCPGAEKDCR